MSDHQRIGQIVLDAIPIAPPDPITWAEEHVQFPSSARSKHFNISVTPWLREPIMRAVDLPTRIITLMKPVQSGGSAFGEVIMLYWIMFWTGFLQYNWSNNKRATDRWNSRLEGIIKACGPVAGRLPVEYAVNEIDFGNVFLRNQGAFVADNLDSDSIPLQINEEVHSWEPGHLSKARNRSTAVWNFKSIDVSNAGDVGDQLDKAYCDGTQQVWMIKCQGCGKHHIMRTKWDEKRPELGGLRYDADGARVGSFDYNYNKIRPTIHYMMPCGFKVHNEDINIRRKQSLEGRYSDPLNPNAEIRHRSYTYESVIVDYIDWMDLIKAKHSALKARALGDPEPWKRYKREKECIPYNPEEIPINNAIEITSDAKKSREGLPPPRSRFFALDRQIGERAKGELPHWWLVIRDFKIFFGVLRSVLVYEGKIDTDEQVIALLDEYECERFMGVADSGDDTSHVYAFCFRHGINAIKGGNQPWYAHEEGTRRMYSIEKPLHAMLNCDPKFPYIEVGVVGNRVDSEPDPREPMFWLYSKGAIRERLHWLRNNIQYEIPSDVSDDYKSHMDAEERRVRQHPRTGEDIVEFIQIKRRNDLYVCECYIAMILEMSGAVGESQIVEIETNDRTK